MPQPFSHSMPSIQSNAVKAVLMLAALLLAGSIYMQFANGSAGDKDWLLLGTRMWLQGKIIYETAYFDINSPLLNYIYALPAYLALHTPIPDYYFLTALGFVVIAFCIATSVRIAGFSPLFQIPHGQRRLCLLLAFIFIFFTNPAYFFHREQIFLILILPYILLWLPSVERLHIPNWLRILVGCMAGVGFCMKPHCMVVWLMMQAMLAWRYRTLRFLYATENVLIYAVNLFYVLSILYLAPHYLTVVLPMALESYGGDNSKKNAVFYLSIAAAMLGVTLADFRIRDVSPYRRDIFYLLGICGCFVVYALVNNGWGYTYNPLFSVIYLTIGWIGAEYAYLRNASRVQGVPVNTILQSIDCVSPASRRFTFGIRACIFVFLVNAVLVLVYYFQIITYRCEGKNCGMENALLAEVKAPDHMRSFGSISIEFMPWVGLARQGAPWETRFHHLWMLPKFFAADAKFAASHRWITDYVSAGLAGDLAVNKPEVVFVDDTDDFMGVRRHIDLVAYFSAHDDFRRAWEHYHYVHTIDKCPKLPDGTEIKKRCSYKVYRRAGY